MSEQPGEQPLRRGVLAGSFNPPTVAHLSVSRAALKRHRLDVVVWSISKVALAKEDVSRPLLAHRLKVLESVAQQHEWLEISLTEKQLLSEIAQGFDVIIMGADKWHQIHDAGFYGGDTRARDASIAALPTVAVAARPPHCVPDELALNVDADLAEVSSTAARFAGCHVDGSARSVAERRALMLPAAAAFDELSGAWTDPDRYERWLATQR